MGRLLVEEQLVERVVTPLVVMELMELPREGEGEEQQQERQPLMERRAE